MKNTERAPPIEPQYIVYPCDPTSETRGRSDTKQNGCRTWSLRVSQRPLTGRRWKMQMKCKHCGNRPRVGAEKAHVFSDPTSACRFMDRKNASVSMRMAAEDEGHYFTDVQWNEQVSNADLDRYSALPLAEGIYSKEFPFFVFTNYSNSNTTFSGEEE